jgi:hypothetical protein
MTLYQLMSGDPDGAALGAQENRSVNSAQARLDTESATGGCGPFDLGTARPIALSPTCPLRPGEAALKSILDPSFRYTASFDTDLERTFARVRLDRRRSADEAKASIRASGNVSPIVRKSMIDRPYVSRARHSVECQVAGWHRHDVSIGASHVSSASEGKQEEASAHRQGKENGEAAEKAR